MSLITESTELLPINIAGERRLGRGDESVTLYPATGEVVARLRTPSLEDVQEAIQKADHALAFLVPAEPAQPLSYGRPSDIRFYAQVIYTAHLPATLSLPSPPQHPPGSAVCALPSPCHPNSKRFCAMRCKP